MSIENISGPDVVPSGFYVNSEIPRENDIAEHRTEEPPPREENKGNNIDSYA